jgi:DNA-binding transcriptional regulator YhcF (GntR family)
MPHTPWTIAIDPASDAPKYRQIIEAVLEGVGEGRLRRGDPLPSINEASETWTLARETVVKAYADLKERGIITSQPGKGFYVATDHVARVTNVFVLFDVLLTPYKERLYDGIRHELEGRAQLDFYFHHHNPEVFCKLLGDAIGRYSYYVVMPFPDARVREALARLDQDKLLLLDIDIDYPGKRCAVIRQSHDAELERALDAALDRLRPYRRFTLVFRPEWNHPRVIPEAFRRFCQRHELAHAVVHDVDTGAIEPGDAFFVIEDEDLVALVKHARQHGLTVGRDLGILSYNETPFKEIVESGITTVSVDFEAMGRRAAREIMERTGAEVLVPTDLILRGSL